MYFFRFLFVLSMLLLPTHALAWHDDHTPWYAHHSGSVAQRVADLGDDIVLQIPIPVLFGIDIGDFSPNFGVPRSGGRTHEGQDILSPIGTPLVSPTNAVVTYIRTGPSAGHSVYTAAPGGETFAYLHMDEINPDLNVGDVLDIGDYLGTVGDTGNATGIPHLHFEMLSDHAQDPFPRIGRAFTLREKMEFTERMLANMTFAESKSVVGFLLAEFEDEFLAAKDAGILLPSRIADVLGQTTKEQQVHSKEKETAASFIPDRDLTIGSRGVDVRDLQRHLIDVHAGSEAKALAQVGATGYFGNLTKAAVLEYQRSYGITPTNGYYGIETQRHVKQFDVNKENDSPPVSATVPAVVIPEPTRPPVTSIVPVFTMPTHNMTVGSRGEHVQWLQQFLINSQSGNASFELKHVGATGYFGNLTKRALAEYQQVEGIRPAVGYFGPLTRSYIKKDL